jgi:hypothetical protein
MTRTTVIAALGGLAGLTLSTLAASAAEILPPDALAGTIWASTAPHDRVTIGLDGKISLKEGKDIYIAFGDRVGKAFTIKINWWNVGAGLNVVEYAVVVPEEENVYAYVEPHHPADSGFPGIEGHGTIRILDANTIELTQIGRLADGSASGFVTRLTKVDKVPEVPLAQTYPKP